MNESNLSWAINCLTDYLSAESDDERNHYRKDADCALAWLQDMKQSNKNAAEQKEASEQKAHSAALDGCFYDIP